MARPATNRYKPDPRQATSLFLHMIAARETSLGKPMTRARLPEGTLKELWNRELLTEQFLAEVQEWMLTAGWALINCGSTFGAVKVRAILNWPRVSLKRIRDDLTQVSAGLYDYEPLEHLWVQEDSSDEETDESE